MRLEGAMWSLTSRSIRRCSRSVVKDDSGRLHRCWQTHRSWSSSSSAMPATNSFEDLGAQLVSQHRLRSFLEAEVTHFAAMPRQPLTLEDLLRDASSPLEAARHVYEEIPKHFAARLRQIEELPQWQEDVDLKDLHQRYYQSFQEMRMTDLSEDLSGFTQTVRRLKDRQKPVLQGLGKVLSRLRDPANFRESQNWNAWAESFLRSRISTEMLTSQYLEIDKQVQEGRAVITGIVNPECDPSTICEVASRHASMLCAKATGVEARVVVEASSKVCGTYFSFIPVYLHYVLLEVLKNSCMATARAAKAGRGVNPVHVVICTGPRRVAIRISDEAGGVPFSVGDRVWDFVYSSWNGDGTNQPEATPLSGHGIGLPLSRLYARYLGGDLILQSLPDYGVDVYLELPRIDARAVMHSADSVSSV